MARCVRRFAFKTANCPQHAAWWKTAIRSDGQVRALMVTELRRQIGAYNEAVRRRETARRFKPRLDYIMEVTGIPLPLPQGPAGEAAQQAMVEHPDAAANGADADIGPPPPQAAQFPLLAAPTVHARNLPASQASETETTASSSQPSQVLAPTELDSISDSVSKASIAGSPSRIRPLRLQPQLQPLLSVPWQATLAGAEMDTAAIRRGDGMSTRTSLKRGLLEIPLSPFQKFKLARRNSF